MPATTLASPSPGELSAGAGSEAGGTGGRGDDGPQAFDDSGTPAILPFTGGRNIRAATFVERRGVLGGPGGHAHL